MTSVPLPVLSSAEHDCLMTDVQVRSNTTTTNNTGKKHKHPSSWMKSHLCQNRFTFCLCLSLFLSIIIIIALLCLYSLHSRIRVERKSTTLSVSHRLDLLLSAPLCLTPECISLAADTYNAMDLTVDPCEVSRRRRREKITNQPMCDRISTNSHVAIGIRVIRYPGRSKCSFVIWILCERCCWSLSR